jgi:hypothetical protein
MAKGNFLFTFDWQPLIDELRSATDAMSELENVYTNVVVQPVADWTTITTTTNTPASSRKKKLQRDMLKAKAREKELARMTAPEPGAAKRKIRL